MARLTWGAHGERFFETGTDRGVLYLPGKNGVPWNGLKAVNESPTGGEPKPYYIDGYKYLNVAAAEEYAATLEAFTSPLEFGACDGTLGIHNGLFVTQQPRSTFGLSYRTLVGNDRDGAEHGYKIHVVYNALAAPSSRNNQTIGDNVSPLGLSWSITTQPPLLTGIRPTAHFVIDSRLTPPNLLAEIEDILYGSVDGESRLPSAQELNDLFKSAGPVVRRNSILTPRPTVYSGSGWNAGIVSGIPESGWVSSTANAAAQTPYIFCGVSDRAYLAGDLVTLAIKYRVTAIAGAAQFVSVIPHVRSGNVYYRGGHSTRPITLNQDEVVILKWTTPVDIAAWLLDLAVVPSAANGLGLSTVDSGFSFRATEALIEPGWTSGSFFDGNTPDTEVAQYDWEAAVNASPSTMRSWYY